MMTATRIQLLLVSLNEEANEIGQGVDKILRFGLTDKYPDSGSPTTRDKLIQELNDLMAVVDLLVEECVIPVAWKNADMMREKQAKVEKYLQYSKDRGILVEP